MCGIIGFTGRGNASDILIRGLKALEYRGYDSAGVALGDHGIPSVIKSAGRISVLEEKLSGLALPVYGRGIAHTRWATHGKVSDENSHPHSTAGVCIVHNGIIENYYKLEEELRNEGYTFRSETDTEAALALIDTEYKKHHDPEKAIFEALKKIHGSYAFGIIFSDIEDKIYAIRNQSPLVAAYTECGAFIASDVTPLLEYTRDIYRPSDGVLMVLSPDGIVFRTSNGERADTPTEHIDWDAEQARKGGFDHFMQKEIFEIPEAVRKTVSSYMRDGEPHFDTELLSPEAAKEIKRIHIAACGTAMHAGLIGKRLIERFARVPVSVETASEFRYKDPILDCGDLMILLSQSGETADTLASLRYAKEKGIPTLAIVNVFGSSIAVEADSVLYTKAGPEIAVASTKAYTVQCVLLALIALRIAASHGRLTAEQVSMHTKILSDTVPDTVASVLLCNQKIKNIARTLTSAEHIFFIGRGIDSDICTEGSLKLKEISYIHSEAYPSGELKHGTISLISDGVPVIAVACERDLCEKMISGIREVKSRGAHVTVLTTEALAKEHSFPCDSIITVDDSGGDYTFIPAVTSLQLLAYHVSALMGLDVDKPRNLAKSVTVE